MTHLTVNLRPVDRERVYRTLVAWLSGDRTALDAALAEAMADPIGVPSLLFGMTAMAAETLVTATGNDRAGLLADLRADLLDLASANTEGEG